MSALTGAGAPLLTAGSAGLVAVVCAAAAAWVAAGPPGASRRVLAAAGRRSGGGRLVARRITGRTSTGPHETARAPLRRLTGPCRQLVGTRALRRVAPPALAVAVALAGGLPAGAVAGVVAAFGLRRQEDAARAREAATERQARITLCQALAAELRAGRPPSAALRAASCATSGTGSAAARTAAGVAELGGDAAAVLRRAAVPSPGDPGGEPDTLHQLAACWSVAERSGAGLEVAVRRLAEALRARERERGELAAELAGAHATARLLAVLPGLGLLLAAAVGAQPLAFLLGTPLGAACLLAALGLDLAGVAWTRRLTAGALGGRGRGGS